MRTPPSHMHPVDQLVGARVRARRKVLGMSQTQLGIEVGVTFQQIQKYERGRNRVSASMLYDIADAMAVDIPYFFGDTTDTAGKTVAVEQLRERQDLLSAFSTIRDSRCRESLLDLIRSMAASQ